MGHADQGERRGFEARQPFERRIALATELQNFAVEMLFLGKCRNSSPSDIFAASANSLVVVPAKPLRANSGRAEATIALRRSSLSNRMVAMATAKVSAHLPTVNRPFEAPEVGRIVIGLCLTSSARQQVILGLACPVRLNGSAGDQPSPCDNPQRRIARWQNGRSISSGPSLTA